MLLAVIYYIFLPFPAASSVLLFCLILFEEVVDGII
jgi:hypothetical protein